MVDTGEVLKIGRKYMIIYDDKGIKPLKKVGTITQKEGLMFTLEGEYNGHKFKDHLNALNIIRAEELS